MAVHNFSSAQVRQEDQVFKVSINYFVSLRPAQDTRDSLSKQTKARTEARKGNHICRHAKAMHALGQVSTSELHLSPSWSF